ncbi:Por secretion system C-terminal sorting domain-containing protein [Ekhidna lutea]|uniref:Por secretion system C-terminal sorting domain-containing protein n=1 Tax=Ekhidna lutea TaxID=447679 RepID=A0A239EB40_EKHLU|nr:Por secretion system C-terminal sorting domain-containing protein [Ekhidna lutea]
MFGFGQQQLRKIDQQKNTVTYAINSQAELVTFSSDSLITAIVIRSQTQASFYLINDDSRDLIPLDEHAPSYTYFLSLSQPQNNLTIETSSEDFELIAVYSGTPPKIAGKGRIDQSCDTPPAPISQEEWRVGLPEPNYSRSFHDVSHNIVHHSAGSNSNTTYTQVVRDIYVYHTQVNGWSDIGYNYLISQDGALYAGRDPADGSQDRVRGAHFCGANSNTLGVCLLGNYETAQPTNDAWITLEDLLTYELTLQENDPFDEFNHSTGLLGSLAGHRDGCSTLCPGENVYTRLNELRNTVNEKLLSCLPAPALAFNADSLIQTGVPVRLVNESEGYENYQWILEGANPHESFEFSPVVNYPSPGFFDVMLIGSNQSQTDTLRRTNYIQVSRFAEPKVFPNPATAGESLSMDFSDEIEQVELRALNGKLLSTWTGNYGEMRVPEVRNGIYLFTIQSQTNSFSTKLIVR